jgi:hypothetical protein
MGQIHVPPPPLLFIVSDGQNPYRSNRAIKSAKTSHISSRYRYWNKAHHKDLALDSTTKAILNGTSPPLNKLPDGIQRRPFLQLPSPDPSTEDEVETFEQAERKTAQERYTGIKPWAVARQQWREWVGSPLSVLGSSFFDIFTPTMSLQYDVEIKSNLYFYLKVIKPFAMHLLQSWNWFDDLAQIQASPCLTYAIAAFSSVFMSGMLRG